MIRRKSNNAIECIGSKDSGLYCITEEQFLFSAHVDLDRRAREAHLGKLVASLGGDFAARLELGNLVHDAENYFFDYSTVVKDEQATCNLASSNHKDVLELMHDRTGHGNKSMLVEYVKSKLVTGLKISEKHIRHFRLLDHHVCDVCARSKATRHSLNKVYKFRENKLGACVSVDIAVFVNCPSREGYKCVVGFTDHATKRSWVYPMKDKTEFVSILKIYIFIQLRKLRAEIEHFHADGGKKLTSKEIIVILKGIGASYSWNLTDTPE